MRQSLRANGGRRCSPTAPGRRCLPVVQIGKRSIPGRTEPNLARPGSHACALLPRASDPLMSVSGRCRDRACGCDASADGCLWWAFRYSKLRAERTGAHRRDLTAQHANKSPVSTGSTALDPRLHGVRLSNRGRVELRSTEGPVTRNSLEPTGSAVFSYTRHCVPCARGGLLESLISRGRSSGTLSDVRELFDSIYRGFPIGTAILWRKDAPSENVNFGPYKLPC